jgi:hypothetical protein
MAASFAALASCRAKFNAFCKSLAVDYISIISRISGNKEIS